MRESGEFGDSGIFGEPIRRGSLEVSLFPTV